MFWDYPWDIATICSFFATKLIHGKNGLHYKNGWTIFQTELFKFQIYNFQGLMKNSFSFVLPEYFWWVSIFMSTNFSMTHHFFQMN